MEYAKVGPFTVEQIKSFYSTKHVGGPSGGRRFSHH